MRFEYVGDEPRTFPHVSLEVAPGDVIERDENPEPRYFNETDEPIHADPDKVEE